MLNLRNTKAKNVFYTFLLGGLFFLFIGLLIVWSMADDSKCPHCKKYFAKSKVREISREPKNYTETYYDHEKKSNITIDRDYDYITEQNTCKYCGFEWKSHREKTTRERKW